MKKNGVNFGSKIWVPKFWPEFGYPPCGVLLQKQENYEEAETLFQHDLVERERGEESGLNAYRGMNVI